MVEVDGPELVPRSQGVRVWIGVPIQPLAVANGEHFTAGAYLGSQPLATLDVLVDYDETWPNGKDCDDVPCRNKSLEMKLVK